jgi:uncharacterized membrane protein (UPF0127 family)
VAHFLAPLLSRPHEPHILRNERTGLTLATTLEPAFDSRRRRRGLLGRTGLPQGTAIVLAPCGAIHTLFMRFSIDVVFASRDGIVAKVSRGLKPWRAAAALGAFAAIELAPGGADGVQVGDPLRCTPRSGEVPRKDD